MSFDDLVSTFRAFLALCPDVDYGAISLHYTKAVPDTVLVVTPPTLPEPEPGRPLLPRPTS